MKLSDKVAVVTGAAQGIGRGVAEAFAREGALVAVVDIQEQRANAVAEGINAGGGKALGVACDVSDRESVEEAAAEIRAGLGTPPLILVNNAGITRPAMLGKMTDQEWDPVLDTHLKGAFHWVQTLLPDMQAAQWGRIINVTSAAGVTGTIGQINYSAAKAALIGFTRSAARELAKYNILVNAIGPAAATPMTETVRTDERFADLYLSRIPLRRWAEPSEIAPPFVFLASEDASYVTGQLLHVDGGLTMC